MAERISNPVVVRTLSTIARPTAEQARALLVVSAANKPDLDRSMADLNSAADDDIIDDGREAEGVRPVTVLQYREAMSLLAELIERVQGDPRLPSVYSLCSNPLRVQ